MKSFKFKYWLYIFGAWIATFAVKSSALADNCATNETGSTDPCELLEPLPEGDILQNFPQGDIFKNIVQGAVKVMLIATGLLLFVALVVASIMMIISMGKEAEIGKAKNIILYSVIGLVIIATSYAIIFGISSLEFFLPFEK